MKKLTALNVIAPFFMATILTACGGGGSSSPATSSNTGASQSAASGSGGLTSTAAASSVTQGIDYYGDSTVWGFLSGSAGTQVSRPEPQLFAEQLPAAARYAVTNQGVSRTTACQLLAGTDGQHPDWTTQMTNSTAKFVIINHAINDARADIGESVGAYQTCLTNLARIAKQKGKKVIFETPNPTDDNATLQNYVAGMRQVASAEGLAVIDQYQYLNNLLAGADVRTICPDGTHPDEANYAVKARFAASEFLKLSY